MSCRWSKALANKYIDSRPLSSRASPLTGNAYLYLFWPLDASHMKPETQPLQTYQ